jgi:hypothetical protein
MSAPAASNAAPGGAQEAAKAATLLDTLARAPAAAALVVAALARAEDRKALRLAHPQLWGAVGEAATKLSTVPEVPRNVARPPTARRWPRLEELHVYDPDLAAIEALGAETWSSLRTFRICYSHERQSPALDATTVRALAAALRRMPGLRSLKVSNVPLSDAATSELFDAVPQVRALLFSNARPILARPALPAVRMLAATKWRLEELTMSGSILGGGALAAHLAAPTFAIRRLSLRSCRLGAPALLAVANAPWPLEELDLSHNIFDAAGPELAALSRHAGLCKLAVYESFIGAAGFKALVEAASLALTYLDASYALVAFHGPHALGAAAFARFPEFEELSLFKTQIGAAGALLLASRRWARLRKLDLTGGRLGDAGLAALARDAWPALQSLGLSDNGLGAPPSLAAARRWAPALDELVARDWQEEEGSDGSDSEWSE